MEGEQQALAAAVHRPVRADRRGHGLHPRRIDVIVGTHPRAAVGAEHRIDDVADRGGRRRRILRIQRQHLHLRMAGVAQLFEHGAQRRVAVTHGVDHARLRHLALHGFGQPRGVHRERRAAVHPHAGVELGHARRAEGQDHEMQDRAPQPAGQRDHAVVVQELGEIAADRLGRRRIGGAEIHQDDGGNGCRSGRVHPHRMAGAPALGQAGRRGSNSPAIHSTVTSLNSVCRLLSESVSDPRHVPPLESA